MISTGTFHSSTLDFSAVACKGQAGDVIVERKICEGFCGGLHFTRVKPKVAKAGAKLCETCAARLARMQRPVRPRVQVLVSRTPDQHWDREIPREMARLRA